MAKTPFTFPHVVLEDFFEEYPEFLRGGKVELWSCVYYPLADLELETIESSSEEFETIEHSVLELIYGGVKDIQMIADMMGLTPKYIEKLVKILEGYGHVLDFELTALGMQSVRDGVKYQKYSTRQKVQVDPLSGSLITREMHQPRVGLLSEEDTNRYIPHLQPLDPHVEEDIFQDLKDNIDIYKKRKNTVFYLNIDSIERLVSKEINFAYGFLVKFEKIPDPFVLLKCKRTEKMEDAKDAFYWKPVAISNNTKQILGLYNTDINVVSDSNFDTLKQIAGDIKNQLDYILENLYQIPAKIEGLIKSDWCIDLESLEYELKGNIIYLSIDQEDIVKIDKKFLKSLFHYDIGLNSRVNNSNFRPYVRFGANHVYPGLVCYAKTNSGLLKELAYELQTKLNGVEDIETFNEENISSTDKLEKILENLKKMPPKEQKKQANSKQSQLEENKNEKVLHKDTDYDNQSALNDGLMPDKEFEEELTKEIASSYSSDSNVTEDEVEMVNNEVSDEKLIYNNKVSNNKASNNEEYVYTYGKVFDIFVWLKDNVLMKSSLIKRLGENFSENYNLDYRFFVSNLTTFLLMFMLVLLGGAGFLPTLLIPIIKFVEVYDKKLENKTKDILRVEKNTFKKIIIGLAVVGVFLVLPNMTTMPYLVFMIILSLVGVYAYFEIKYDLVFDEKCYDLLPKPFWIVLEIAALLAVFLTALFLLIVILFLFVELTFFFFIIIIVIWVISRKSKN
ncbi:hypothetical protein [Natranaerofaba carboxydovora]|uniref:hypothetical protein n=1 Tax=Natranaerofaba carboxydovora TaxID=2742683 RepID=UPI001F1296C8|nr:hypothetical protein [Natranaerofaba carboxydovora]UMZ74704.1 hypothetical protein ACONDI_02304 [Natranaerofaba carboxydovora]